MEKQEHSLKPNNSKMKSKASNNRGVVGFYSSQSRLGLRRKAEKSLDSAGLGPMVASPQYTTMYSGDFLLVLHIQGTPQEKFSADVEVSFKGELHFFLRTT